MHCYGKKTPKADLLNLILIALCKSRHLQNVQTDIGHLNVSLFNSQSAANSLLYTETHLVHSFHGMYKRA